jgi:phenylalanine-4-hydroxylase
MFEEAQLYSPGPVYRAGRSETTAAGLAWEPAQPSSEIANTEEEQEAWRTVCRELPSKHARYAVAEYGEAIERVALPVDRVPGLDEVSARLQPLTTCTDESIAAMAGRAAATT